MKKIFLCYIIITMVILTACGNAYSGSEITDVNNLEGRRIGVGLAWGPDFLLTDRDDMEIVRYNNAGHMILALKSKSVDAIAFDYASCQRIVQMVPSLKILDQPVIKDEYILILSNDRDDLRVQFNEFIKDFKNTETYDDIIYRNQNLVDGEYNHNDVQQTGDGPTIYMTAESYYPYTYHDFVDNVPKGSDVEIATHFANAYGYRLEVEVIDFTAAQMKVVSGEADFMMTALSIAYSGPVEWYDMALTSDPYMESYVYFLVIGDESLFGEVPEGIL